MSKRTITIAASVALVISMIGFFGLNSIRAVNSDDFIFAASTNIFLKSIKSPQGNYHYQYVKGGKSNMSMEGESPQIMISKENLVQIHFINEEKNQSENKSQHNLNIDEFNVHTGDLEYFQTKSITFLADKTGTFDYYCSIHPEMRGTITVT